MLKNKILLFLILLFLVTYLNRFDFSYTLQSASNIKQEKKINPGEIFQEYHVNMVNNESINDLTLDFGDITDDNTSDIILGADLSQFVCCNEDGGRFYTKVSTFISAFDGETYSPLWTTEKFGFNPKIIKNPDTNETIISSLHYNGITYEVLANGFNATDGSVIWEYTIAKDHKPHFERAVGGIYELGYISDDNIKDLYVSDLRGSLYALNGLTGELLWKNDKINELSPLNIFTIDNDTIPDLILSKWGQNKMYVVNGSNGNVINTVTLWDFANNLKVTVFDANNDSYNDIFFGNPYLLGALDGKTGDFLWKNGTRTSDIQPITFGNRTYLLQRGYDYPFLIVLDPLTGNIIYNLSTSTENILVFDFNKDGYDDIFTTDDGYMDYFDGATREKIDFPSLKKANYKVLFKDVTNDQIPEAILYTNDTIIVVATTTIQNVPHDPLEIIPLTITNHPAYITSELIDSSTSQTSTIPPEDRVAGFGIGDVMTISILIGTVVIFRKGMIKFKH